MLMVVKLFNIVFERCFILGIPVKMHIVVNENIANFLIQQIVGELLQPLPIKRNLLYGSIDMFSQLRNHLWGDEQFASDTLDTLNHLTIIGTVTSLFCQTI